MGDFIETFLQAEKFLLVELREMIQEFSGYVISCDCDVLEAKEYRVGKGSRNAG